MSSPQIYNVLFNSIAFEIPINLSIENPIKLLSNYNYLEDLNNSGYDCVSNTPEEILGAIEEIEYYHRKNKYLNNDMDFYNEKFRKIYYNHFGYKIKKTKICNSFLKLNKDLIN